MYWEQTAEILVRDSVTDHISIYKGVRQVCILSHLFFNIYSERIYQEPLATVNEGIKVNVINNIRYADDTTLLADSLEGL